MDSLVGYGSDDDNETERYGGRQSSVAGHGRRREDDTNYDDVNMDMSEDSQAESEPELPPAEPAPSSRHSSQSHDERRGSDDSRDRDRDRDRTRERDADRRERRGRDRPERRSPRREDRHARSEASDRSRSSNGRRGLLGSRPDARPPALMDLRPFGGEPPPEIDARKTQDARDAVSPRFVDRERRDRDRERDRDRHSRRSEEKRPHRHGERDRRERSRSRGAAFPPPSNSGDRRGSPPSGDYRPSSYKVNKKLEVMEKMGLQIKTPDGSMATAQQLRAAAGDAPASSLPSYYNPSAVNTAKILDQKRKLLWSSAAKAREAEAPAGQWSGARFAQDNDGRQASKFMRLMGIKDPDAVKAEKPAPAADPIKKQEELFQAMQAQYEVARATTHTMRGVGLGFQRSQY